MIPGWELAESILGKNGAQLVRNQEVLTYVEVASDHARSVQHGRVAADDDEVDVSFAQAS